MLYVLLELSPISPIASENGVREVAKLCFRSILILYPLSTAKREHSNMDSHA